MNFLQNELPQFLRHANVRDEIIQNMWFQQDGAPAHTSRVTMNFLNQQYQNRFISLGRIADWPPSSPDMTPLDFFFWGHIKEYVYSRNPQTQPEMVNHITDAFQTITPAMLDNVQRSILNKINLCVEVEGQHFENFIKCRACNPLN